LLRERSQGLTLRGRIGSDETRRLVSGDALSDTTDPPNSLGESLRRYRLAVGLTQEEFSERSGLSVRSISDLERGRTRRPRRDTLRRVADVLKLPATDRYSPLQWQTHAQLPADLADFTGRRVQVDQLTALLTSDGRVRPQGPVVIAAVAGPAGIGKTALAVHVAHQVTPHFPDGQIFVQMRGAGPHAMTASEVLARLLRDLGVDPASVPANEAERATRFRSLISGRRMLLVFDDARDAASVRSLLPGAGGCAVLVTSRQSLPDLESARRTDLDVLDADDAATLFTRIVGPQRTAAEPEAVSRVLRACGALPLAIRIAAVRLTARPGWSIGALAGRLYDAHQRLDELRAGDLAVRASFMVSYASLRQRAGSAQEGLDWAFRLLGLAEGPDISLPAAAALLGVRDQRAEHALELLVDANLLQSSAPGRYRFHDLLRVFSAERASAEVDPAARASAIRRLLSWYLGTASAAARLLSPLRTHTDPGAAAGVRPAAFGGYDEALAWLEAERVNLVAAVGQAAREGEHEIAWKLPGALLDLFALRCLTADWIATHQTGLASARFLGDWQAEVMILNNLAGAYLNTGRAAEAIDVIRQATPIVRARGEPAELAKSLANLGFGLTESGFLDEAAQALRESLGLLGQSGDDKRVAMVLAGIGLVAHKRGDLADAVRWYTRAAEAARAAADQNGQVESLIGLSSVRLDAGDLDGASRDALTAVSQSRQAGARLWEAKSLAILGRARCDYGDTEQARRHWLEAQAIFADLDVSSDEAEQVAAGLRALGHWRANVEQTWSGKAIGQGKEMIKTPGRNGYAARDLKPEPTD
jgi:transcriptional regulator with XRE-family HTH domain/tetratricopeptide (TPR) repeat protein